MTPLAPFRFAAGLALPPRCPGCGAVTIEDHRFCVTCWSALRFLGPPWCAGCNLPFDYDRGEGALCAECHRAPPRHAGVRAAVAYGEVSRTVALKLKYGGRTAYAETVARQMARLMPAQADLLVPVPLHRWRIWSRGYNQAALIATALARTSGIAADLTILHRIQATPSMRGLGPREREKMVARAFQVDSARKDSLRGKAVILVDDVHTSGATSDSCSRMLLRAGVASVTILCWARVLDATQSD
ncbi:ComF family protein [Sphingomonas alpina]|uniref:ComF family protein n=1 Tax=Sphingomonas alpina TaxID=653931 RepID=A0A7H0LM65_9SPHN|nr:ComF family protein [Sphingomonas alpina]QNQ10768.1 ComF family protein [Sphingomonas alpina]